MVYGTYNYIVTGAYKPTYNWGASHWRFSQHLFRYIWRNTDWMEIHTLQPRIFAGHRTKCLEFCRTLQHRNKCLNHIFIIHRQYFFTSKSSIKCRIHIHIYIYMYIYINKYHGQLLSGTRTAWAVRRGTVRFQLLCTASKRGVRRPLTHLPLYTHRHGPEVLAK